MNLGGTALVFSGKGGSVMESRAVPARRLLRWGRLVAGPVIIAVLIWKLGTGPFVVGLRAVDAWSLVAAVGIMVVTTVCSAWRWTLVARGIGLHLPMRTAVMAYYRAQFLNTVLPGGVLGDVHRALAHGRDTGSLLRAGRAVIWERLAGQVVQVALAAIVLAAFPPPASIVIPLAVAAATVVTLGVVVLALRRNGGGSRLPHLLRSVNADLRNGVLARHAWPGIAAASVVAVCGYAAIFVVAAHTAGTTASASRMLPLAALVLLAIAVPANIGGWGPREGAAAWAFGAAGLGAQQGVATATVYGVLIMASSLPGAVVLLTPRLSRSGRSKPAPGAHGTGDRARRRKRQIMARRPSQEPIGG